MSMITFRQHFAWEYFGPRALVVSLLAALLSPLIGCYASNPCDENQVLNEASFTCIPVFDDEPAPTPADPADCNTDTMGTECGASAQCGCDAPICLPLVWYCSKTCELDDLSSCPSGFVCLNVAEFVSGLSFACVQI